jgi:hypothetical protein
MQSYDAEDENDRKSHDHDGVDLQPRGFIGVQL